MRPSTRRTTAAATAEKRAAEPAYTAAGTSTAKQARTPAAATAANEQATGAAARPANGAVFAHVRTPLLGPPSQERAGYLGKSVASDPGVLLDIIETAPGAEGPLLREFGDWGLWLCGRANPLMRERAGLLMLCISPIYHTCPVV